MGVNEHPFEYSFGVGSAHALDIFVNMSSRQDTELRVIDYKSMIVSRNWVHPKNLEYVDYEIAIAFSEIEKWIYVYDNGFPEVGLYLSNTPFSSMFPELDNDIIRQGFLQTCDQNRSGLSDTDRAVMSKWRSLAAT